MRSMRLLFLAFALALTPPLAARADDAADIRERLAQWTDDFNAKRADKVCDLFSRESKSDVRGQGETDYATRCDILKKSLADPSKSFHYDFELKEILVIGDVAVVRLTWTLFITPLNITSLEEGMDVFRKEADGKWRIIRYMSYEEE